MKRKLNSTFELQTIDSSTNSENANTGDWQEEVYQKIKSMSEMYLPELNEMYQRMTSKLQQHDSLPQQPKNEQLEKLRCFKVLLERIMIFLRTNKNEIQPNHKLKIVAVEKQITSIINTNRPRKPVSSLQQGQVTQSQMYTVQKSQQLGLQNNVSGFQQQPKVVIQHGDLGLQPKIAAQQQMQQNMANLLPNLAHQSQSQQPPQQLMSQILSQPRQMQQQVGLQQAANPVQREMQQSIQTSGLLLLQQPTIDQSKQLLQSQRILSEIPQNSSSNSGNANNEDWQEVYQKIKSMSEMYLPELNEMYQRMTSKLHKHNSLPQSQQPKNERLEKLRFFKVLLERIMFFLRTNKDEIQSNHKLKIVAVEKQITSIINTNRPRKPVSSLQQGQVTQSQMYTVQKSQQLGLQNNVSGFQQQPKVVIQHGDLGLQPKIAAQQQMQQNMANLLPNLAHQSQPQQPPQQLMSQILSQPRQMQQQVGLQHAANPVQREMQQSIQTSGLFLLQQPTIDQSKQLLQSQRILSEIPQNSSSNSGNANNEDWQEVYQKIKSMSEMYLPELNEMYQRMTSKLHKHNSLPQSQQPKNERLEKLRFFKVLLERIMFFLRTNKDEIQSNHKLKIVAVEKQITSIINTNMPRKPVSSLQQGQVTQSQMYTVQKSQQLGLQNNVSGFQQQPKVVIQHGDLGLQPKIAAQQQMQQNMANLLPNLAHQSQPQQPPQQLMSQILSQPRQMQQQVGLQHAANPVQREMQQSIQTSGLFLLQQPTIDQSKQLLQSQRILSEIPQNSSSNSGNANNEDWQEVYQKIKSMSEMYLPELNEMYQRMTSKLHKHNSLPQSQQPKNERLEKLRFFKVLLERIMFFLRTNKDEIQSNHKLKIVAVEKQITSIINTNRPRKPVSSLQQGQVTQSQMYTVQKSQQLGLQNNVSGFQQQPKVVIQHGDLGLQPKIAAQQQMQQNMANLLPNLAHQSQPQQPPQQLMSQILSQPRQMQQQVGLQHAANPVQREMQQSIQTSGLFLLQQPTIDQSKQLLQSQRILSEIPQNSSSNSGNANNEDWQEEVYQKIKSMSEMYLPELNEMYQRMTSKLQKHDSLPQSQQPKNERLEKLRFFKVLLERIMFFLRTNKDEIQSNHKLKIVAVEKQITSIINSTPPPKPVS